MIVLQHQHAVAGRHGKYLRGGGHAIADRRDQRDVVRRGVDQRRRGLARAVILLRSEFGVEQPRPALARHRGAASLERPQRQRAIGCGIEIADIARNIERRPLRRQHLALSFGATIPRPQAMPRINWSIYLDTPTARIQNYPARNAMSRIRMRSPRLSDTHCL